MLAHFPACRSLRTGAELPDALGAKKIDVQELTPVTYAQLEAKKAKMVEETRQRVLKHTRSRGAGARLQEWPVAAPGLRRAPGRCGPNGGFYLALGRSVTREGPSAPG